MLLTVNVAITCAVDFSVQFTWTSEANDSAMNSANVYISAPNRTRYIHPTETYLVQASSRAPDGTPFQLPALESCATPATDAEVSLGREARSASCCPEPG